MPPKKAAKVTETQLTEEPETLMEDTEPVEEESIEVQVNDARKRKKQVPAHVAQGKSIQAKGAAARRAQGAASTKEREVERLIKRNNQLERIAKIDELEKAEKARAALIQQQLQDKPTPNKKEVPDDLNHRLAKLEELLTARMAEKEEVQKPKTPARRRAPVKKMEMSSSEDEEPPRQKAVRRSAKTELARKAGAHEEQLHARSTVVGNKGKKQAMSIDKDNEYIELGRMLMPGAFN